MHVVNRKVLDEATKKHSDVLNAIRRRLTIATAAEWHSLVEIRRTFRDTDFVKGQTVFNIGGNKYRLWTSINYETRTIFLNLLQTHADYSRRKK